MKRMLAYIYVPLTSWFLYLSVAYPTDQLTIVKQHLSSQQARAASLSVAIPLTVVWLVAIYSAQRLYEYSASIKLHPDGPPFKKLAIGVQLVALYLPLRGVTRLSLNYLGHMHPTLLATTNVIATYLNLILPLVAFVFISYAAHDFARLARAKGSLLGMYALNLVFIGLGVAYCYAVFTVRGDTSATNWLVTSQQDIPTWLIATTVVVPYLFMWFVGLIAAYEIYLYQKLIKGIVYRKSLRLLSLGLIGVILVSIGIQFFTAIAPDLQTLPLRAILIIAYSLIMLLGAAFVIIARGVRQLKRLDEV